MPATTPKSQIILGYRDLFGQEPPADRLSLLRGMDKDTVLAEIARLNYSLKPKENLHPDTSFQKQVDELWYMCGQEDTLHKKYVGILDQFPATPEDYPILFTRQACLFAAEEIIQSDLEQVEGFSMGKSWDKLLKYYLAVNTRITDMKSSQQDQKDSEGKKARVTGDVAASSKDNDQTEGVLESVSPFEDVNQKMLVLNELSLSTDPFYMLYRGYRLLEYWAGGPELGGELTRYLEQYQGMAYPQFIYELASLYFGNNQDKRNNLFLESTGATLDTTFMYFPAPDSEEMFQNLSRVFPNPHPIRLTSIRKYPFHRAEKGYFVMDSIFMLEKGYTQFINDFWFDWVRGLTDEKGRPGFRSSDTGRSSASSLNIIWAQSWIMLLKRPSIFMCINSNS